LAMAFDILQRKGSCLKYKPFYRQIHIVTSNVAISTALSREKKSLLALGSSLTPFTSLSTFSSQSFDGRLKLPKPKKK
jgi:hypothetical protein